MKPTHRVAIVGMGGIFSGSPTLAQFWDNVRSGRDTSRDVPPRRWLLSNEDAVADGIAADKVYSPRGYFLDDIIFDPAGWNLDADLLARLDPVFHLTLHAGSQAWRDAKTFELDRDRAGVIFGNIVLPTEKTSAATEQILGGALSEQITSRVSDTAFNIHPANRFSAGMPAFVLAKALGLEGTYFTLDAACASSLYAIKLAADKLLSGEADAMLAGGVSRPDCLYTQMGFSQLRALATDGRCRPFDAQGSGLVVGEGAGFFALKRLEDALAQDDRIYGVLAGFGLSNDVAGNLLAPDSEGQLRALRSAYQQAGWRPDDVDLIECHATGTPLGDGVELNSLKELWGECDFRPGQCVIGSVKSSVGHNLTAAGAAGLLKVLLSFQNNALPPTANFEIPRPDAELEQSPFRILRKSESWITREGSVPRRAAVSAFGFGGINAHLLVEEWRPESRGSEVTTIELRQRARNAKLARDDIVQPLAVVGFDCCFGGCRDVDQLQNVLFDGDIRERRPSSTKQRWWGVEESRLIRERAPNIEWERNYIEAVEVPLGQFRIAPRDLEDMLPQQLLMLQVAAGALEHAQLAEVDKNRIGVFIGLELDLNTTNYHLRWWIGTQAREWNEKLRLNLSPKQLDEWIEQLREAVGPALTAGRVLGNLGSITASRIARAFGFGGPSFTVSAGADSGLAALETAAQMLRRGEIDYAVVGAVDFPGDVRAALWPKLFGDANAETQIVSEGAAAFVLRCYEESADNGESALAVIEDIQKANDKDKSWDFGDSFIGYCGAANGMASLAGAVASLHRRVLPRTMDGAPPRYWLHDRRDGPLRQALPVRGSEGKSRQIYLRETPKRSPDRKHPLQFHRHALFAVDANNDAEIRKEIARLRQFAQAATADSIGDLAQRWWQQYSPDSGKRLACTIIASDPQDLLAQLDSVQLGSEKTFAGRVFRTPENWSPGKLAFVFPGSGNHFAGMGRDLSVRFADIFRRLETDSEDLHSQFQPEIFWDGSSIDSRADHRRLLIGQVAVGCVVSELLQNCGIRPNAALGYSLGESTALLALGVWANRNEMTKRMLGSPLFLDDLAGDCHAARKVWGLSKTEDIDWLAGVVNCPADRIREIINGRKRVYLLIINSPVECVIGGQRREVEQLVREMGCTFLPLSGVSTVHCDIVRQVESQYRNYHRLPTEAIDGVDFYSGAWSKSYRSDEETCADAIVGQAVKTLDFDRLIRAAYEDGVRCFLEVGTGASCTRMIGQILGDKPHLACSSYVAGQDCELSLLQVLAQLVCRRVPVDLSYLYGDNGKSKRLTRVKAESEKAQFLTIPVGRPPVRLPGPPVMASPPTEAEQPRGLELSPTATIVDAVVSMQRAKGAAHEQFLRFSKTAQAALEQQIFAPARTVRYHEESEEPSQYLLKEDRQRTGDRSIAFNRDRCLEFAIGAIRNVLGEDCAEIDSFPTRVRLPAEPLMLVDRVVAIEGEANSLQTGRIVTEKDIAEDDWYLDAGKAPASIAIESGQADLFLSAYLGIDFRTRGLAVYRLLDAAVTFHRRLPQPGEVVRYDIHIDNFFRQGDTHLFRFRFEGTVNGEPLLTMRDGCAGFFTPAELATGKGIVQKDSARVLPTMWGKIPILPSLTPVKPETWSEEKLNMLRAGDLVGCFGEAFRALAVDNPLTLPGGRLRLIHRIVDFEPHGGPSGLGSIRAEQDIHADDWFLTCHFIDDRVMPGTLMYECCLHALRFFLLRIGWIAYADRASFEPKPGVEARLRCRGQVVGSTRTAGYEITIKEFGREPFPYAIGDALMYADGKAIVEITGMSLQLTGVGYDELEEMWGGIGAKPQAAERGARFRSCQNGGKIGILPHEALFTKEQMLEFARGNPSRAYGERYRPFDKDRRMARLPAPPYSFIDRVVSSTAEPWKMNAGGVTVAEFDILPDAWYFQADRQKTMPFAALLEVALQPCGWTSAYIGSALTSEQDLRFRNLGGKAKLLHAVGAEDGVLQTTATLTQVSSTGGMIIQNYEFSVANHGRVVYEGDTYFGFFTDQALAQQVGIRDAKLYHPSQDELRRGNEFSYPGEAPFPDRRWRMIDHIDLFLTDGGPHGKGFIRGSYDVDPDAWFFQAHFYQDPVCPGSMGLESLLQLLKVLAARRFGGGSDVAFETPVNGFEHEWIYRGQVIPANAKITVQAEITDVDEKRKMIQANGWLSVDGIVIYEMIGFSIAIGEHAPR